MWRLILFTSTILLHSEAQLFPDTGLIKNKSIRVRNQFPSTQGFFNFSNPNASPFGLTINDKGVSGRLGTSSVNFRLDPVIEKQPPKLTTIIPVIPIVQNLAGRPNDGFFQREWNDFRTRYNKVYSSPIEEQFRREIFIENVVKIQRNNQMFANKRRSFSQQVNQFADRLLHEFSTEMNGFNISLVPRGVEAPQATAFIPSANVVFPDAVDWRDVGAVSDVKSQGKCAACWAFAAAGALEGHHFRKTGQLVNISVQNLIDCTGPYGNSGCSGGLMNPAFEYVQKNRGVDSETSYPFEERTADCRFKREDVVATCTGFVDIDLGDEKNIEVAVATLGPVTAAIDAGRETFQFYGGGVYDDPDCGNTPEQMNHAVLIVGYGKEPNGQKFWMVKNSYGPDWGMGGYIKIAKENGNQCGIAIQASYPLV